METTVKNKPNHLIEEKSPYLLQHAYNPVDWYPWGEVAFKKAKREDKPIFLSIGYSTCHWCHVMAEESFEDQEVADLINEVFIPIKVDREERPDIDNIYMTVCQLVTGSGGWPLTIFLTPEKKPFFAGTYIPKKSRYGRTGMLELIPRIADLWQNERDELLNSAGKITEALKKSGQSDLKGEVDEDLPEEGYRELKRSFDNQNAGFGQAPKFPIPHQLLFLLHYWNKSGEEKALEMVELTLLALRSGGIYDQLGSGFHRYSTDQEWVVPHFEKMLYDQALLAYVYLEAYQATGKRLYADTVKGIFNYLKEEMRSPGGGFFSAEDADSEGEEGLFYLWKKETVEGLLSEKAGDFFAAYNIKPRGNFIEEGSGISSDKNILYLNGPGKGNHHQQKVQKIATELEEEIAKFKEEREMLYKARKDRIHPGKDDKILTDWNGLLIAALARGAFLFNNQEYLSMAEKAVEFIFSKSYQKGRLYHRYRDGEAAVQANLDDYAFLCWGLIELYEASLKPVYLEKAISLNNELLNKFRDKEGGGFYFTGEGAEGLLTRSKEIYDGAIPSGNSVVLWNMVRLSHLTGNQKLQEEAAQLVDAFANQVNANPSAYTMFLTGFMALTGPYYDLVITAANPGDAAGMIEAIREGYYPYLTYLFKPEKDEEAKNINSLAHFLKDYQTVDGKATAYVCKNFNCQLPVTRTEEMVDLLET